jgi:hypothetical protein
MPEVENNKVAMRTAEGSWRARMESSWTKLPKVMIISGR